MKKYISHILLSFLIILYVLFYIFDVSFASDICNDRVYINIMGDGSCGIPQTSCTIPTGCTSSTFVSGSCISVLCHVCCPKTDNEQRSDSPHNVTVTNVPLGDDKIAASTAYADWRATATYPTAPDGYSMTGTMEGYVYNTTEGTVPGTVDVNVTMWLRGFYTKNGTADVIPIENLGSGVIGTGDIANSVRDGVGNAIDDKFGTGLTVPDGVARTDGKIPGGSDYVPGTGFGTVHSLVDTWGTFKTDMQATELFGLAGNFASGAPTTGGVAPVMAIEGGDTFGYHEVDFAIVGPWLIVLRGAILLAFAFCCIKIITLKGGGG